MIFLYFFPLAFLSNSKSDQNHFHITKSKNNCDCDLAQPKESVLNMCVNMEM